MASIDMSIPHIIDVKEAVERLDVSIPEGEPEVYLICPACGHQHVLKQSDVLELPDAEL